MGSNFAIPWVCSTYAEGNCDSNVPFGDTYNTQLRVGLLSLLLPALSACILLAEHILLVAWLRGSFPRFRQHVLVFVLPTYPLRLDRLAYVEVSIPLGERWLCLHDVPLVVLSYGCSLVDD